MRLWMCAVGFILLGAMCAEAGPTAPAKEFLTPLEIEKIQDAQEISTRVKLYLEFAALRLKTAAERLSGKESTPGDPLEFFSVEDMMDGYFRILRAVMMNLDDASQHPKTDPDKFQEALKSLKLATEAAVRPLAGLKKLAEEKLREEVWNLVNKSIDVTEAAHEGAVAALKK